MEKGKSGSGRKLFKTAAIGFNKKDVCAYLEALSRDMSVKLKQKEDEIARLMSENKRLFEETSMLRKKQVELDSERDAITKILIKAEESAKKVMDEAQIEAEKQKAEIQRSYVVETNKMYAIKKEIAELRQAAIFAIKKFEAELAQLEGVNKDATAE